MQRCVQASRSALGERWLDVYLTSPIWRFAFSPGVCGPGAHVGTLVPSVDRVGRYFPMTVVAELPAGIAPLSVLSLFGDWFDSVERLLLHELEQEAGDFEMFDAATLGLGDSLASRIDDAISDVSALQLASMHGLEGVHVPLGSLDSLAQKGMSLLQHALDCHEAPAAVWTTHGSERVAANWIMTRGLPQPPAFVAMMDGDWRSAGWWVVDPVQPLPASNGTQLGAANVELEIDSAGVTDAGAVRSENQDAFLSRPDLGLWVVADGMGGHSDGARASQMIKDALAGLEPKADLDAMFETVMGVLRDVNAYLYSASSRPVNPVRTGSTVVALVLRGTRSAFIWSGDSRAYLLRDAVLQQITRDHSEEQEWLDRGDVEAAEVAPPNVITRAIGGLDELEADVSFVDVRAGDRLLLCSDGLYRALSESEIQDHLESGNAWAVASGLLEHALQSGATDNVTAVVLNAESLPVQASA
jgi:type VI secretion system protein ImpM